MVNSNLQSRSTSRSSSPRPPADWWRALCSFAPVSLVLRLYSFGIMCFDFAYLIAFTGLSVLNSVYRTFKAPPLKSVKDEVAVIVGASRGVGRELAIQLSDLDARVVCVDINEAANDVLVENIKARGGRAYGYTVDVTVKEDVENAVKKIEKNVGPITMLFHCCGVPSPRSIIEEPAPVNQTLNVSIVSHFWLLENILPKMKSVHHGHIVLLTSVAGLSAIKYQMPLSVAQFAVQGIYESLVEDIRMSRYGNLIHTTIVHIYPFIVSDDLASDIRLRIPSYFGTINARDAADRILIGVRRNDMEVSIPGYLLYVGHLLRLLPRRATSMLRDLLDTGVDF